MSESSDYEPEATGYRHEALFYAGRDEFVDATLPFLEGAAAEGEPTLVVVSAEKIADLQAALGDGSDRILFADMAHIGTNPARIIPAWVEFLRVHSSGSRQMRGIGEPIWAARSAAELAECQRHEALLNAAFGDPAFWLLCPYDTSSLSAEVLHEAHRNHPLVNDGGLSRPSAEYPGIEALTAPFDEPLPDPPVGARTLEFAGPTLDDVRSTVARWANEVGLSTARTSDLVVAVNEVAGNSLRHGGGRGTLLLWRHGPTALCEVRDRGQISDPMADRMRPDPRSGGGRGLWLANQLCELVQIRSNSAGTAVRLHMSLV